MSEIHINDNCIIYNDMEWGWISGRGQPTWHKTIYDRWILMWRRCRHPKNKDYENYKDCEIDEKYHYLSNYVNDIMQLENFDKLCSDPLNYHIDKDKIDSNNKCYSFEHLSIIPSIENIKLAHPRKAIKGVNIHDGSVIYFDSQAEATENGFKQGNLSACLNGKRPSCGGYKWQYVEESE